MAFTNLGGTAVPIPQIGEDYMPHGLYTAVCRLGYGISTADLYGDSNGLNRWTDTVETISLFDINSTALMVHSVSWDVEALFTGSVTITLGDSDIAGGYASAAQIAATVISTGCPFSDTTAALDYVLGRRYGTTQSIDATIAGANPLKGKLNVYCVYSYAPEYPSADTEGSVNT